MRSSLPLVLVMLLMIAIVVVGAVFLFRDQGPVNTKKAVRCQNDDSVISFLINEDDKSVIMEGQAIDPSTIQIFNETAVSADWAYGNAETRLFLDRIAGRLELRTRVDEGEWDLQEFDCNRAGIRF